MFCFIGFFGIYPLFKSPQRLRVLWMLGFIFPFDFFTPARINDVDSVLMHRNLRILLLLLAHNTLEWENAHATYKRGLKF